MPFSQIIIGVEVFVSLSLLCSTSVFVPARAS